MNNTGSDMESYFSLCREINNENVKEFNKRKSRFYLLIVNSLKSLKLGKRNCVYLILTEVCLSVMCIQDLSQQYPIYNNNYY